MWILRLVLIVAGIAFVAAVYWYTRRHPPRKETDTHRIEPSFTSGASGSASTPTDATAKRLQPVADAAAQADFTSGAGVDLPRASSPAAPSPSGAAVFTLALRLSGEGARVASVVQALERLEFEAGEQQIYHRRGPDGAPLYSAANLFEPGLLHPLSEDTVLRGLVFFFQAAPGLEASSRFDRMLGAARECARHLGGRLEDGNHRPLTAARELELKLAAAGARDPT